MNPKEFTKNQKVRVIYGFDGMHIKDDDVYELMQKYADLQLLQTCVRVAQLKYTKPCK